MPYNRQKEIMNTGGTKKCLGNILIAEDEARIRDVLVRILTGEGYNTIAVGRGDDALAELMRGIYEVAILDAQMPGLGAIEILTQCRTSDRCTTPIIILTASISSETMTRCLSAGASKVLIKPVRSQHLLDTIDDVMTGAKRSNDIHITVSATEIIDRHAIHQLAKYYPGTTLQTELEQDIIRLKELTRELRTALSDGQLDEFRQRLHAIEGKIEDKIHAVRGAGGTRSENQQVQEGNGGELEMRWRATSDVTLQGWYAYQRNVIRDNQSDAGFSRRNSARLRLDWRVFSDWYWDTNALWVADRERQAGDNRPPVSNYTFVNTRIRYKSTKSWSTSLTVFNVFDKFARDPSNATGFNDHALPPRSLFFEYRQDY